ncbi:hypothetical protein PLICRDRAFT_34850 [Plicaturopsis crispa FD-325 SS-3]|nr:hypothetical protein PLICRDRAFT_34850 [Plicaturopsis crispa FD-325 SS-3]
MSTLPPSKRYAERDGTVRITQRAPMSCIECTRRKTKCDRKVPCSSCIRRSAGSTCTRERVLVKGTTIMGGETARDSGVPTTVQGLLEENRLLREQNAELRAAQELAHKSNPRRSEAVYENELERMAIAMNLLELGRDRPVSTLKGDSSSEGSPPSSGVSTKEPSPKPPVSPADAWPALQTEAAVLTANSRPNVVLRTPREALRLPSDSLSTFLVEFAVNDLGWLYMTVHGPTFLAEHSQYLVAKAHGQHCGSAWMAFYFSQLAIALHHIHPDVARRWGLPHNQVQIWFDTSLRCLYGANFMSEPDLRSVQTICNLSVIFHIYGHGVLRNVLLAVGVRVAHLLGLHLLQEAPLCESDREPHMPCTKHDVVIPHLSGTPELLNSEIGLRTWWFLLYREWLAVPAGLPYSTPSENLDVSSPSNISDSVLSSMGPIIATPMQQPTTLSYHIARIRLSRLMHQYFARYRALHRNDPNRYKLVQTTDNQLLEFLSDMPFFNPRCDITTLHLSADVMKWLPSARHLLTSLICHKRLLLHRDYFAIAFSNPRYRHSHDACVAAALDITKEWRQPPMDNPNLFSEETSHLLAATVVLTLDHVYPPPGVLRSQQERQSRRGLITELSDAIRQNDIHEAHATRILGQIEDALNSYEAQIDVTADWEVQQPSGPHAQHMPPENLVQQQEQETKYNVSRMVSSYSVDDLFMDQPAFDLDAANMITAMWGP